MSKPTPTITLSSDPQGQHADLYLIGVIGSWYDGNTVDQVLQQLQSMQSLQTITVHLSSIGGTFSDGLPIYNLLRQHPANVTVDVLGYAVSMGSVLMLAGDKVRCAQNSLIMIHNAQGSVSGDYRDFRAAADLLQKHQQAIIPRYAERTGKTQEEIQALLDSETWFTANEALAVGLVDEIIDPVDLCKQAEAQPRNAWEMAVRNFRHPPAEFIGQFEAVAQNDMPWFMRMVNKVVGKPPENFARHNLNVSIDPTPSGEKMDKDELKLLIEGFAYAIGNDLKSLREALVENHSKPTGQQAENTAESPEMQALRAENSTLKAIIEDLKKPVAGTTLPANTGAVEEDVWNYKY